MYYVILSGPIMFQIIFELLTDLILLWKFFYFAAYQTASRCQGDLGIPHSNS